MRAVTLLVFLGVVAFGSAATINWTGNAGNSLWNFATNWAGNTVPSANDDVIINLLGGVSVTISQPAVAKSVSIGGGAYAQTLTLLSSLSVGTGGITVGARGTLQLSGNNDLPLVSTGNVTALAGGAIVFNSGEIKGPGVYVIKFGASIVFSGSALKLIYGTDVLIYGTATIQPTTIQLANGAAIKNYGDVTAVGLVNIFSTDKSQASFFSYGNFSYEGTSPSTPLTFQLQTFFAGDLVIKSGGIILNDYFHSTANVTLPQGTTLTIDSGDTEKIFGTISGAGSIIIEGMVEVDGVLAVSWVTVSTSGSLTLHGNATTKSLGLSGKLVVTPNVNFLVGDASVTAGTITGTGQVTVSGNFEIAESTNGNTNTFISTRVNVVKTGYTTGPVVLLFSGAGNLNILRGATFSISAAARFLKQSGNPVVTNNGTFTITLSSGSTFYSNVDHKGSGALNLVSGLITFEADVLITNSISAGSGALLTLSTVVVTSGTVSGLGSVNITAAPTPESVFGNITLAYFGVPSGNVRATSISVNTLELFNGQLTLSAGLKNKATIFNFYGGALRGNTTVASSQLLLAGSIPQIIDRVTIQTNQFNLRAVAPESTLISENGAQIIAGSN